MIRTMPISARVMQHSTPVRLRRSGPATTMLRRRAPLPTRGLAVLGAAVLAVLCVVLLAWGWIAAEEWMQRSLSRFVAQPAAASAPVASGRGE